MGVRRRIADLAARVEGRNLSGAEGDVFTAGAGVLENACLVTGGRYCSHHLSAFGLSVTFVVGEEEELVLEDGTAEIAAEDVADEFAGAVRQTAVQLCLLIEEIVGYGEGRAMVLVYGAVEFVGA